MYKSELYDIVDAKAAPCLRRKRLVWYNANEPYFLTRQEVGSSVWDLTERPLLIPFCLHKCAFYNPASIILGNAFYGKLLNIPLKKS